MRKSLQELLGAAIGNCQRRHYAEAESLGRQLTSGPSPASRDGNPTPRPGVARELNFI
jgi:hypothetical protein